GAVQQHVRDKMHGENHFENDKHAKLDQRFPSARNEVHHPARRFQHQKRQPEMAEDAEGAAAATPVDFQLWFDFRFEDVQMFVNAKSNQRDRKSTRLNSSHQIISYAVFCLKKKKKPVMLIRPLVAWT